MSTRGERLREARIAAGYGSASAAATALNVRRSTYNAHERAGEPGGRDYGPEDADRYGRKFSVSDAWLLTGKKLVPHEAAKTTKTVPMLIVIKAEFDPDSESWWATADIDDRHALATGAPTLNELLERIPIVLRDLLAEAYPDTEIPFSIVAHKFSVVNTQIA
jgi:phage repressor protein C with HTH and peptisase S24 domain